MFQCDVEKEKFALKPMNCPGHWFAAFLSLFSTHVLVVEAVLYLNFSRLCFGFLVWCLTTVSARGESYHWEWQTLECYTETSSLGLSVGSRESVDSNRTTPTSSASQSRCVIYWSRCVANNCKQVCVQLLLTGVNTFTVKRFLYTYCKQECIPLL